MSNLAPSVIRHASRVCKRDITSSAILPRSLSLVRLGSPSCARSSSARRSYVSETKQDKAQVNVDTTIRADHNAFLNQTGKRPEDVSMPGLSMGADAMMSPAAGMSNSSPPRHT